MDADNKSKFKVGINTLFLIPGEVGGTETYLRQTLLAMAEYFPEVPLVLFTNRENDPVLKKDLSGFGQVRFELLNFGATNRYSRIIREQFELPGRVKRAGVDVLWSPGYTAPLFSSCPQVVTIPDMQYKTFPQDLTLLARVVTDVLVNMAVCRSRRIIAISNFSKDEIADYTGASKDKIDVIHLAVNSAFGKVVPEEKRKTILSELIPVGRPYILSIANTYPHKNIHSLVKAFGDMLTRVPHNLILVGNANLGEKEVQNALHSIPDKKRVIRLQNLSMQQLVSLYQGCDLFVFPSLYEGFGLPVLEALMAGVPVVTSKRASIPEVGGEFVEYVDTDDSQVLADRIADVLKRTPEARKARTETGKQWAAEFTWQKTAELTLQSITKAIS